MAPGQRVAGPAHLDLGPLRPRQEAQERGLDAVIVERPARRIARLPLGANVVGVAQSRGVRAHLHRLLAIAADLAVLVHAAVVAGAQDEADLPIQVLRLPVRAGLHRLDQVAGEQAVLGPALPDRVVPIEAKPVGEMSVVPGLVAELDEDLRELVRPGGAHAALPVATVGPRLRLRRVSLRIVRRGKVLGQIQPVLLAVQNVLEHQPGSHARIGRVAGAQVEREPHGQRHFHGGADRRTPVRADARVGVPTQDRGHGGVTIEEPDAMGPFRPAAGCEASNSSSTVGLGT